MSELQTMIELTNKLREVRTLRRLPNTDHDERVRLTVRQEELQKLLAQSTERWLLIQGLVQE